MQYGFNYPRLALVTCYVFLLYSQVKGESHASVCESRSRALIPTGARSGSIVLPKSIIISVPRTHCWKGSASKPYVELPSHTTPLRMEVGPSQACAVKVVVHELIGKEFLKKHYFPSCTLCTISFTKSIITSYFLPFFY